MNVKIGENSKIKNISNRGVGWKLYVLSWLKQTGQFY